MVDPIALLKKFSLFRDEGIFIYDPSYSNTQEEEASYQDGIDKQASFQYFLS